MPKAPPHRCAMPGCPHTQPCPEHSTPWQGSRNDRMSQLPADWPQLRARILRRDHGRCYLCGGRATQVDHVVRGTNHDPANLRAICKPCHDRKSAQEGNRARGRTRP